MRFTEFKLSEATLQRTSTSSWPTYLANIINSTNIAVGPQGEKMSGLSVTPKDKAKLKALLKQIEGGNIDRSTAAQIEELPITFTGPAGKVVVPLKHIHKSAEIKGGKNAGGSEKKPWNEGEVAETILGAALYARFISRKAINANDVWGALRVFSNNVIPGGFRVSGTKRNKKSPIDMTAINKPLNNKVINDLVHSKSELEKQFPEGVKALEDKISACAAYVNESSKVLAALEKADASPGAPITIKTDGVGDQKGTKADLQINVGNWVQLLSLKVNDVKQFGQQSGSSGTVVASFFQRFMPDLDLSDLYMTNGVPIPWQPEKGIGWPDMDNKKTVKQLKLDNLWDAALEQVYKLTGVAYQKAAAHLQEQLSSEEGAAQVIKNIYNGIIHHAQGNAQFQTLVILNPTTKVAWKELEFGPDLEQALGHYNLTVDVQIGSRGGSNHKLRIFGTPTTPESIVAAQTKIDSKEAAKNAKKKAESGAVIASPGKEMLFQLRSYQQESGNMRNPVEMGPLLKDLTEVQQMQDLPDTTPEVDPVQQAPVQQAQKPLPGKMTPIEPATSTITPDDADPNEITTNPDELDRIRKNAGITVE